MNFNEAKILAKEASMDVLDFILFHLYEMKPNNDILKKILELL